MEFACDGGGIAKGGDMTLFVDGRQVGAGRVEQTEPFTFSADEDADQFITEEERYCVAIVIQQGNRSS